MSAKFSTSFFATFDDSDPGGIVFFGNYYRIAHRALEQMIIEAGISWKDWFGSKTLAAPLIHSEADYMQPIFAGKNYSAEISVENIGNTSVSFMYALKNEAGDICSKLKTVHVFLDIASKQKTEIPEEFASKLKAYLA